MAVEGGGAALSRIPAREKEVARKKMKREEERAALKENIKPEPAAATPTQATSATSLALAEYNRIWSAVTILKYGSAAAKTRALQILEMGMDGMPGAKSAEEPLPSKSATTESPNGASNSGPIQSE